MPEKSIKTCVIAKVTRKSTGKFVKYTIFNINIQGDMFVLILDPVGFAKFEMDKFTVEISMESK